MYGYVCVAEYCVSSWVQKRRWAHLKAIFGLGATLALG